MNLFSHRAVPLAGSVVVFSILVFVGGASPAGASSARWRPCPGTVSFTNPSVGKAMGSDITARGAIGCQGAKRTVRVFLRRELEANQQCATAADDPPYRGCRVGAFTCRRSASLLNAKGCVSAGERVDFREHDVPLG